MINQREKILVVEDEVLTGENLRIVLESCDYEVLPLMTDGEDALELVRRNPPDLVLMDIKLGGKIDGIETARRIRESMDIPVIYLTASSDKQTMERAKISEPQAYILKPFNEYDLGSTIEIALYKSRAEKQVRREKEINAILARLSQALLESPDNEDIANQVEGQIKCLTHSKFGFVAYIDPKSGCLENPTLSKEVWDRCRVTAKTAGFKKLDGLGGWIVEHKQTIISNDLSRDPRASGMPEGHIPIHNFIGVPALAEDKLVGILAAANKETDYDENDAELLRRLAIIYALALQQKKNQAELALYRNHLEELVEARTRELEAAYEKLKTEISERERAEQQLLQADKMIALGTLVSGVAHEINNPNNYIMMNAPFLQDLWEKILPVLDKYYHDNGDFTVEGFNLAELKDTAKQLFAGIQEGTRRIQNIVNELKDFSRPESDEIEQSVDINLVVKSAVTLTSPMIHKATRNFIVHYGQHIPTFPGKFQRLEQVIINLIQNSCQALTDNEKSITITTAFNEKTGKIIIEVEDEGIGIQPQHLKLIMNPFFTTRRDTGGTGLGLSISSNIITNHAGTMDFQSTPGKGTIARIILPLQRN